MSRIGGLDISQQRSELLTGDQLTDSDFVFTMSRRQAREAAALSPAAASRIRLLGAFAPAAGKASGPADPGGGRADSDEIADPMGGDDAAYAACYRRLNDCVSAVAAWLRAGADPAEAPPAVASWNIHR
jgi:protein-tyrosine-phosphatase